MRVRLRLPRKKQAKYGFLERETTDTTAVELYDFFANHALFVAGPALTL